VTVSAARDPRTGRPLKPVQSLTDDELELELTVAASAPNQHRTDRYQELLDEKARRVRRNTDGAAGPRRSA
jgi:hypothetical protein